jgi:methionyl-tRNA synthetase
MPEKPKFYLTTPIYYANGRPHVGSSYTTLVGDTIARYKRMRGYDVAYLTGTDEHGENIARAAAKAGVTPREHVDRYSQVFRDLWKAMDISHTHFIRTTSPDHLLAVHALLRKARDAGYIYKGEYRGRYCVHDNLYVSDSTEPTDCPTCGRPAELVSEENYFFKLSAFQDRLLELYEKQPEFVQPDFRRNEVVSFVRSGLRDISVSRKTVKWGLPWPDDPEHVIYVWYDALTSYMTGVGFGKDEKQFEKYWPADLHLIGKEIIRFHGVYWPAFLMAAGLPLPKQIFAHGWLLFEQEKMSKSKGNVAYPEPIVQVLGTDALRYYLLREVVFGQDGNFSHDALVTRYNSDLANDLGNLASRVLTMIGRYFEHGIPYPPPSQQWTQRDRSLMEASRTVTRLYIQHMDALKFESALVVIWDLIGGVNKYLVEEEPWTLAERNTDADRSSLAKVLYIAADLLRLVTGLLSPVMPEATAKIWRQLGLSTELSSLSLDALIKTSLEVGEKIGKVEPVFPRLGKEETLQKLFRLQEQSEQTGPASHHAPATATAPESNARLPVDEFLKWDLRVGEVLVAERVKGASKLLRLEVDIGTEVRQIVAGIAESYAPEALIGRKVVILANLEPRRLRGIESNGMIIAASVGKEDRPVLVGFTEDAPNGARLR